MSGMILIVLAGALPPEMTIEQYQRAARESASADWQASGGRKLQLAPVPDTSSLSFVALNRSMRKLLRREAVTDDPQSWRDAVVKLVMLYAGITRDERLATSRTLEGYRVKLRRRLLDISERLEREERIEQRSRLRGANKSRRSGAAAVSAASSLGNKRPAGGTNAAAAAAGARGGAAVDYGNVLVELIQRTISPEFWDVNGGPGTIVYYRQWHALVIRATPEIHRRIGGGVNDLR
jgi:hypothetical protein